MIFKSQTPWPWRLLRIALIAALVAWLLPNFSEPKTKQAAYDPNWPKTNFNQRSVPLEEIRSGGPPRDAIPALNDPHFISVSEAAHWLDAKEPVILVRHGHQARAYPLQILLWHEIVNDRLDDLPLAITFCPLCNSALVFERQHKGQVLDFGTTGKLRHSDLIMYDRQTESWWQQFTGQAIVGHYNGQHLKHYPSSLIAFHKFAQLYPKGSVLSRETGYQRAYGHNPYPGYDNINSTPFLLNQASDPRLPALAYTLGIEWQEKYKLYPASILKNQPLLEDQFQQQPVVIFSQQNLSSVLDQKEIKNSRSRINAHAFSTQLNGTVLKFQQIKGKILDQSGSQWNLLGHAISGVHKGKQLQQLAGGVHFAFAWLAFRPKAEIYHRPVSPLP
ncbi:MAG: DUF3179 domain-containing protein [Gammaproteobacteria bacterium]|nr:DUF3179 domain-containing protein [Gammaproteobacteria bacterium]